MTVSVITGAAGFIGSNLARELLAEGHEVRGIDNFITGRRSVTEQFGDNAEFELYERDIATADLVDVLEGADNLFHQAALRSVPRSVDDPVAVAEANCVGTTNILKTAVDTGVESVVVASSSSVYGSGGALPKQEDQPTNPESPYALSKYWTEQLAIQFDALYGLETVALRYFNAFGPGQNPHSEYSAVIPKFIYMMLDGRQPPIYGDGEQSRDFTHIDNVIQANLLAAESDVSGEAFNVACGEPVTVNELVGRLNEAFGTDLDPVYEDPRPGDVKHTHADISKAEGMLGYEAEVGFEDGLGETVDYFQRMQEAPSKASTRSR